MLRSSLPEILPMYINAPIVARMPTVYRKHYVPHETTNSANKTDLFLNSQHQWNRNYVFWHIFFLWKCHMNNFKTMNIFIYMNSALKFARNPFADVLPFPHVLICWWNIHFSQILQPANKPAIKNIIKLCE